MTRQAPDKPREGKLPASLAARLPQLAGAVTASRIMPDAGAAGRPLTAVIAVMCFLACLALGSLVIISRSVDDWTRSMSSEMTVQIRPIASKDIEREVAKAVKLLKATKGIVAVSALSAEDGAKLLEPWLGPVALMKELPIPRLIEVTVNKRDPPALTALSAELARIVPGATLDNHDRWQKHILRAASAFKLAGYGILFLITVTTIAIVVFATRAAMSSNNDVVEVLHLVGAADSYIALQVQRHFLWVSLKAGFYGAVGGIIIFALLRRLLNGPSPADQGASAQQMLVGGSAFGFADYVLFLLVPLAAALISVVTARLAALRIMGHRL